MNKLPETLKPKQNKHTTGIPQDNILDLRQTDLGKKQFTVYNKEQKKIAKKQAKAKKKEEKKTRESFFTRWQKKRQQKQQNSVKVNTGQDSQDFQGSKDVQNLKKAKVTSVNIAKKEKVKKENSVLQVVRPDEDSQDFHDVKRKIENRSKKKEQKEKKSKLEIPSVNNWKLSFKPLATFVITCLILILPFTCLALYKHFYKEIDDIKKSVLGLSEQAFTDIKVGSKLAADFNFDEASQQFNGAFSKFNDAQEQLGIFNTSVAKIVEAVPGKGQEFKSAKNLLSTATYLTSAAEDMTMALDIFSRLDKDILNTANQDNDVSLTDVIVSGHAYLPSASEKINLAVAALKDVEVESLPTEYQDEIKLMKTELPTINASLKQILNLSDAMLTILGHDQRKRYFVVFQNNRELRATGGFLGSFGLIDIDQGEVTKINIPGGGTYDLNGSLKAKIISPEPLHLVNPIWQIQDSNWWVDWPTSAQKIEWFYNQSSGPTVDGVLALTPDVIEAMLEVTGPIDGIDADNFYDTIQAEAEKKYDETAKSKQIIADLTPKLLDRLFSLEKDNALSVLEIFYNALQEKNILLYFNDELLEEEINNLGWSGSVKNTNGDYLSVVNTNIGGGKTDGVIEEIINHQTEIAADGSIVDTVEITRTHKGNEEDEFANVVNWNYLRLYVPEGSQLVSAQGFNQPDKKKFLDLPSDDYKIDTDYKNISGNILIEENTKMRISKEFNKTVFGNWVSVSPGESTTIKVSYKLPFKIQTKGFFNNVDTYSLLVQKQPGSFDSLFNTKLILADDYSIKWRYPNNWEQSNYNEILNTDKYLGVVLEK